MFPEARIEVTLTTAAGTVAGVRLRSGRLTRAAALLAGRPAGEATRLLPAVFSLCGTAQAVAGLAAVEQAAGVAVAAPHRAARRLLLLAEMVGEHALGMARDWPALLGETPDLEAAKTLRIALARLRPALYPGGDWTRPGGGALRPDRSELDAAIAAAAAAVSRLLAADPDTVVADPQAITTWARKGDAVPARLIGTILAEGLADFGHCAFHPMPSGGPGDLTERLAADFDGVFAAQPDSVGTVFETGPLARLSGRPLARALMAAHGNGLLTRFAIRLTELKEALRDLAPLVHDLFDAPGHATPSDATGTGLGLVEAARGLLAHRVELAEGRVARYQILAPTEWNFHPAGPLAVGLVGVPAADVRRRAALLVNALDPCVACAVAVEDDQPCMRCP